MARTSYFLAVSWQEPRTSYFLAVSWQEQVIF
jgi:hypothetical protein